MSRIQGVIFDYGNVLSRTIDPSPRAGWEEQFDLSSGGLEQAVHNDTSWIGAQTGCLSVEDYWLDVSKKLWATSTEMTQMRTDFYRGDVRNGELVDWIDQIRCTGIRTAILSNFSVELRDFLDQQALIEHFDQIVISAEIGVMKPAPEAYKAVLRMLDLPADACIFIDDLPVNIAGARALGIHGIVFRNNAACIAELDRLLASA